MGNKKSVDMRAQKMKESLPMDFMTVRTYIKKIREEGSYLSEHCVRRLVNDGTIPSFKSGNTALFSKTVADRKIHDLANNKKSSEDDAS